ncbi:unnamed protein product [Paramecium pentaurelia]|uniref:DNA/RNA-binding protein Alba-like domain-containing protein n=1 Tax=Paramecium pentaurelia TaxID=43138 RepID=A0A8S1Y163_9CILI|nr:unnamed protein product [Paramecium pentaurelia]
MKIHKKASFNEIFVKHDAHINRYIKRIIQLFEEGIQTVLIHGLSASIEKCVRIALQIIDQYCGITYKIKTSSQENKSGIHIELTKQLLI